jgi:signal transduction histidine kinase/AcrR family transcriptional regulator
VTTLTDDARSKLFSAAARLCLGAGPASVTIAEVAREAEVDPGTVAAAFESPRALIRASILDYYRRLTDKLVAEVGDASDGADALSRYVRMLVRTNLGDELFPQFVIGVVGRILIDDDAFGITEEDRQERILPQIRRGVTALAEKLQADKGSSALTGGIHPRRLAFVTHMFSTGVATIWGLAHRVGVNMLHSNEAMLMEASEAIGAASSTVRQLEALNVASEQLTRMRSTVEVYAAVPSLLGDMFASVDAKLWAIEDGAVVADELPPLVARALTENESQVAEADESTALAVPIVGDERVRAVLACHVPTGERGFGERDLARVKTFATMVGLALENARFYEDLQALVDERTRELRGAQAALVQSERLAATGTLVASLAHEINTPMGSMLASQATVARAVDKLASKVELDASSHRLVEAIKTATGTSAASGKRLSETLAKLKRFSRIDAAEQAFINVGESLADAVAIVRTQLPDRGQIELEAAELPLLRCHPAQLNQVFLAVLLNAAQAIAPAGCIRVAVADQNGVIVIAVEDDGEGIDDGTLSRSFDPGFTTRGVALVGAWA